MRPCCIALLVVGLWLPPSAAGQTAVPAGDAGAGKTLWEGQTTQCRNCHGGNGEGAYGPDLAGRRLTVAQFTRALRQPWGVMPAYNASQMSAVDIANFVAYFDELPSVAEPGPWRVPVPQGAPHGQVVMISTAGCGQCHGAALAVPRADIGAVNGDFDWFKTFVYEHAVNMPSHWALLGETPAPRIRMGDYSRERLPESLLREIYDHARDLGFRVKMNGELSAGVPTAAGVTYTLTVANVGVPGKALTAEDVTIALVLPADTTVVSTTGAGYQGVRADAQLKGTTAVWQVPRIAPQAPQTYTITLSRAATAADNLRGSIRWTKPAVKPGPADQVNIAGAPVARAN